MRSLVLALILAASSMLAAPINYQFVVDTSLFNSQGGSIDIQYNSAAPNLSDTLTALLYSFSGPSFAGSPTLSGNTTGSTATSITFENGPLQFSTYGENVTFGNQFAFAVTFSGSMIDNPSALDGTTFLINFVNNSAEIFTSIQIDFFPDQPNAPIIIETFGPGVNAVPEPSTLALGGLALAAVLMYRSRFAVHVIQK
jgi:hypothetical protein